MAFRSIIHSTSVFLVVLLVAALACPAQSFDDYEEPKPLDLATSAYPEAARLTGLGGKIWVHVSVDTKGKVTWLGETEGPDWICNNIKTPDVVALREAARDAALRSTFQPATKKGKPVKVELWMTFLYPNRHLTEQIDRERAIEEAKAKGLPLPEKEAIFDGGRLNRKAKRLAEPSYSALVKTSGFTGRVTVQLLVDTDGSVFSARASGEHKEIAAAARDAACRSKFIPAFLDGKPVKMSGVLIYQFVLPEPAPRRY